VVRTIFIPSSAFSFTLEEPIISSLDKIVVQFYEIFGAAWKYHEPDRLWSKAFQPEVVMVYYEG
jgi:hypothetical protein